MLEIVPLVDINIIEETLTRMGVGDKKNRIMYPSCALYKDIDGRYFIAHFKELFLIRKTKASYDNFSEEDKARLISISILLEDWNMVDIISLDENEEYETVFVYVLPHSQKRHWLIQNKFNLRSLF